MLFFHVNLEFDVTLLIMEQTFASAQIPCTDGLATLCESRQKQNYHLGTSQDLIVRIKPIRKQHACCSVAMRTRDRLCTPQDGKEDVAMATQDLWQKCLESPIPLCDNWLKKINSRSPEFARSTTNQFLWKNGCLDPVNVVAEQAALTQNSLHTVPTLSAASELNWESPGAFSAVPGNEDSFCSSFSSGSFIELCHDAQLNGALQAVNHLYHHGIGVSTNIFFCLLERCIKKRDLLAGREVHRLIVKNRLDSDAFLGSLLIHMFALFEDLSEAIQIFNNLYKPNVYSWSAIICAHTKFGQNEQAIELYLRMHESDVQPDADIFVAVLKASATLAALTEGRLIHARITEIGLESDATVANALVNIYAKCGSLQDAHKMFDTLTKRDVATWNAIIAGYCQHGSGEEALQLFQQMQKTGMRPNKVTCAIILRACSSRADLYQGKLIHLHITENGFGMDRFVGNTLIEMYCKSGSIRDAWMVFDSLPNRDVVSWNTMIAGCVQHNHCREALQLFQQMVEEGLQPDNVTFNSILKACSGMGALEQGKQIHFHIIESGFESVLSVGTTLLDMYAKCGSLQDVGIVFNRLPKRDEVTWSVLIAGYGQRGYSEGAVKILQCMRQEGMQPDKITCVCILKACSTMAVLEQGKQMHTHVIELGFESDLTVGSALTDMYAKCGNLDDAHILFGRLHKRDVVTWSVLIAGYADRGRGEEALQLFQEMQEGGLEPDQVTFVCVLKGCSGLGALDQGQQVHCHVVESGFELHLSVGSALIDMYSKSGSLEEAQIAFNKLPSQDVVTWSALIAGYVQHGLNKEALQLSQLMQQEGMKPNQVTFVCMLKACSRVSSLDEGKRVHALISQSGFELDAFVGNSLIDMYGKCGSIKDAHIIFDRLPIRDVVTWNAIIAGYAKNEFGKEALQLFHHMLQEDIVPDKVTYVTVLDSCSSIAALQQGKWIQANIIAGGLESDMFVGSSLVDMYSKCGSLEDACIVFDRWPKRDVVTWSAMIAAYVQHGEYRSAFQCFEGMQRVGLKPNDVTFLGLLSACSHMGLVEEGCSYFKSMREKHGIVPILEHYSSMTDLLGHAGSVKEAEDLLETVPFRSSIAGWNSLLDSCRNRGYVDLGRRCFDHITRLDAGNAAGHVLMANIYAHAGMQGDAKEIEESRRYANAWRKPAKAFIEINDYVHGFIVGDRSHPQSNSIYRKLKELSMQMEKEGYMPGLDFEDSMSDEHRSETLCGHCERLAIAFGLLCTPQGTTIRVTKNLRVCADCHIAVKAISKVELREIIVTDSYYIHHFKDGSCSCKN